MQATVQEQSTKATLFPIDTVVRPASDNAESTPVVSIVIPALNERLTIGRFIDWCQEGLQKANVAGEILIIDSSDDETPEIALSKGASVLKTPRRGLGRAYIDAIPYIRGKYVIMGDCDCTYDFREIKPFVDALDAGAEYVMGTRMKGYIEDGAMPKLHRYFGTPLTTWILNRIYHSKYSDIHCGMRAMTLDALKRIHLESTGWEYASEMVLKASKLRLRITEVPIRFYKDPPGRESVHKRMGWLSPWLAGWSNLRVMLTYAPSFFLRWPGIIIAILGLTVFGISLPGTVRIGPVVFSLHGMLLGSILLVMGYVAFLLAMIADAVYEFDAKGMELYKKLYSYNHGVISGGLLFAAGFIMLICFLIDYIRKQAILMTYSRLAFVGLTLLMIGFFTFSGTLVFQMILQKNKSDGLRANE